MINLSQLLGQEAISLSTADKHGTVKGIGLRGNRIVAVELSDRTIDATCVRSFDGDVLTYDEAPEIQPSVRTGDIRKSLVLDMDGDALGSITDAAISAEGLIESLELDSGQRIDGTRLRATGSYATIVWPEPDSDSRTKDHRP